MDVRLHQDLTEYAALTRPLLETDRIRHSVVLTVLAGLVRIPEFAATPPVLLSVHRGGVAVGFVVCTPPRALLVSATRRSASRAIIGPRVNRSRTVLRRAQQH